MIGLMIGAPGAGKSYELVVYHVLPALRKGYKVITNLPLIVEAFAAIDPTFPDLIELRTQPQLVRGEFDADPASKGRTDMFHIVGGADDWKPHKGRTFSNVWDYYSEWRHPETGNGPLFIIDECHLAMPRVGTDRDVAEYYSKHRHFNVNILLATQSAPKLCEEIRDMVQNCYKVRKALALGKDDSYIRRVLDGYRGSLIEEDVREYKPQFFKLYRSHTQGSAVQEEKTADVTPFLVKFRRATWVVCGLGLVGSVFFVGRLVHDWGAKVPPRPQAKAVQVKTVPTQPGIPAWAVAAGVQPLPAASAPGAASAPAPVPDAGPPEPFASKGVHMVGHFWSAKGERFLVAVSQNAVVVATYTHLEVERMGYRFASLGDCAGVLEWRGRLRTVTCDSPQQSPAPGAGPSGNSQPSANGASAAKEGPASAGGSLGGVSAIRGGGSAPTKS